MGYRVIAVDAGSQKEGGCLELGATAYVDIEQEGLDIAGTVKGLTDGKGASAVIVIAGSTRAYQDAFHLVAPFGTLVCVGITPLSEPIQVHPLTLIDNGIKVIGSMTGTRQDIVEAVEFVRRGEVVPEVQLIPLTSMEVLKELRASNKVSHGLLSFITATLTSQCV
jgi:propanol-preferring alcohol dehydrogenase